NLARDGFLALRFAMTLDRGHELGLTPAYYPPHPSGPAVLLAGLLRLGVTERYARAVPLIIGASGLLACFLLVCEVIGDRRIALTSMLALGVCAPYVLLSDSFCYQSYDFAAKGWSLLFVMRGVSRSGGQGWLVLAAASAAATTFLVGYEM